MPTSSPTTPPPHPALVSLHGAVDAVRHLEGCLTFPLNVNDAPSAAPLSATSPPRPTAFLLADAYEHDWEALTKQLRRLVDQTHPDSERPASEAGDTHVSKTKSNKNSFGDGRTVLLDWNASHRPPPSTNASPALSSSQQQHDSGDVELLFFFLQRLAESFLAATHVATPSSKDTTASRTHTAVPTATPPAKTKAQLQTEDIVEPIFVYGCAVASNLASLVAGRTRNRQQPSEKSGGGVHAADGTVRLTTTAALDTTQEESLVALGNTVWAFAIAVTRLYRTEKRLLHLLLSALSNMACWPALEVDADTCAFIYELISPFYTSYSMVAAWVTLLVNLTAVHGAATVPTLLQLGVVADVERLSLSVSPSESATTERLVVHSLQLLSNVATYVFAAD